MKLTRDKRIEIQKKLKETKLDKEYKDIINKLLDDSKLGLKLYFEESEENVKNSDGNNVPITKQNYILFEEDIQKRIYNNNKRNFNLLIEGDNYLALKHLKQIGQKIDIIYIDPPYNTGNKDFKYNDSFVEKEDAFKHSKWLSFMKKRLELAKDILNDDGIIMLSIDDNEQPYLRVLLDQIFGEENFLNQINWVSNKAGRQIASSPFAKTYEYIILYSKNPIVDFEFNGIERNLAREKMPIMYDVKDKMFEDELGEYISNHELHNLNIKKFNINNRPNLFFPIYIEPNLNIISTSPFENSIEIFPPISNGLQAVWRWSKEKVEAENYNLLIVQKMNGEYKLQTKVRNMNFTPKDTIIGSNFTTNSGTNVLNSLNINFDNPKPTSLIKLLIKTVEKNNSSIILDFFAGSGTTLQSVMEMNEEDEGKRRVIGVTLGEETNEENLATNITYERLYRILNGIGTNGEENFKWSVNNKPFKQNLKYLKIKLLDKFDGDLQLLIKNDDLYKEEFDTELKIELIADE